MKIHLKIKECVNKKGAEIIVSNTLIGMLDDELVFDDVEAVPYKKILRNIIKEGYAQKLLDLGSYTPDVKFLASQYAGKNLMQEPPVLYVLDCLAYGLGWTDKEPTMQVTITPPPPATNSQAAPPPPPATNSQTAPSSPAFQQKKGFFDRLFGGLFGSSSSQKTSSSSTKKAPAKKTPAKTADDYLQDAKLAKQTFNDIESYFENLKKAAKKGSTEACYILGNEYYSGENVVKDDEEAFAWYEKGAKKKDEKCMVYLGWLYAQGKGVECDLDTAIEYFEKPAKKGMGNVSAIFGMGYSYFCKLNSEYGTTRTAESLEYYDTAERWLQMAANKGNSGAQFWLGQLYLQYGHIHVRVVDYDDTHAKAYEWFRMAADQGHKTAKEQLYKFRGYWPGKRI